MKELKSLDIVLSVFNQETLIERVLLSILENTTTTFTLILIFDGCTDKTKERACKFLELIRDKQKTYLDKTIIVEAPNVYETKANNIGFKLCLNDYLITIQDDMIIKEKGWERRLTYPLRIFEDVFAVTSRGAQDFKPQSEKQTYINTADRIYGLKRNVFAIRDVINRGPIAFRTSYLKKLGYLNENYAPSDLDDADICLRAWRDFKWRAGAFWINYESKVCWGKVRSQDSTMGAYISNGINYRRLVKDHEKYLNLNKKHSIDILIDEKNIDFQKSRIYIKKTIELKIWFRFFFYRLFYNLKRKFIFGAKNIKKSIKSLIKLIKNITSLIFFYWTRVKFETPFFSSSKDNILTIYLLLLRNYKINIKQFKNAARRYYELQTKRETITIDDDDRLLSKMPDFFILFVAKILKMVGGKLTNLGKKIFLRKFQKRTLLWHAIDGDRTLRINYDLNQDSVVFDIGGYQGDWTHEIAAKYGSNIHIFEPIPEFSEIIKKKYKNNGKIFINNFGLSNINSSIEMVVNRNSTSEFKKNKGKEVAVIMKKASDYIKEKNIKRIDLIKINIEGGEYNLLEHLIKEGLIENIKNIQVQFHDFIPNAEKRMVDIQTELKKTHSLTYQYKFVWENWELKEKK